MAKMTVSRLIAQLEEMDPEAEVRLAHQPHWPFEYSAAAAVEVTVEGEPVVYIGEGEQLAHLPGEAREALGWQS